MPGGTFKAPLVEYLANQLPEDYAETVAYPWFRRILSEASRGRGWTWSEICPDVVVGFTPNGSGFSLALHWAQYLSLYAYNNFAQNTSSTQCEEVSVPFPGNKEAYQAQFTPVSSDILGRMALYAALHPEKCGGQVINVADDGKPTSFSELWPVITEWFGLKGTGPLEDGDASMLKPGRYIHTHRHLFTDNGLQRAVRCGVGSGSSQLDSVGWWLTFDRHLSLGRLRELGFCESRNPREGWIRAFELFRSAGVIF